MIVRDEVDILPTSIRYHRAQGIDEIVVVDNGSTDGTREALRELAAADPAVRWIADDGPFRQAEVTSELAREAHGQGATWVLPTDADEFWWAPGPVGAVRSVLEASDAGALKVRLLGFIQERSVRERSPAGLLSMRWLPAREVDEPAARPRVKARELSFVEMRYPDKYASRASATLTIHRGNHHVQGLPGEARPTDDLLILHAPVRSRSQLAQRARNGRRRAKLATSPDASWHLRRLEGLDDEDARADLDAEWAACSVHKGDLDVFGRAHPVVRDDRLRDAVAPFVEAPRRRGLFRRRAG